MENPQASPLWRFVAKRGHSIVSLNDAESACPIYFVHSIGGEVTSLQEMVMQLGPGIRAYGIQVPRENLGAEFPQSIRTIAARYVELLCDFQKDGPLMLGGWSAGALIALEMAQMLREQGREVVLLVSFDGVLCNTPADLTWRNPRFYLARALNLLRSAAFLVNGGWSAKRIGKRVLKELKQLGAKFRERSREGSPAHALDSFLDVSSWPKRQAAFARSLFDAAMSYTPVPYPGRVVLYTATVRPPFNRAPGEPSWRMIAAELDAVRIDATHNNLLHAPQVDAIAQDLRERLAALLPRIAAAPG